MPNFICVTCGSQFAASVEPPSHCPICGDERQYIGWNGQAWTTLPELQQTHHNVIETQEPGLTSIVTEPGFAIGQRALLVQTPAGNVLWDCISLIDDATIQAVQALGGIKAIAISHPHFYSSLVEWSRAFGDVPVFLHADDVANVMCPDGAIRHWQGENCEVTPGVMLIRCGGHFAGSAVLHWAAGAEGRGVLLTSDTITVVPDRRFVSFMRSYPNLIPLPAREVRRVVAAVEPYAFDRIYGSWHGRIVPAGAKGTIVRSAERYIRALS
jgi:glyoxylase-like metal-dependent hydrolase (beta-lactamase superfamily II)